MAKKYPNMKLSQFNMLWANNINPNIKDKTWNEGVAFLQKNPDTRTQVTSVANHGYSYVILENLQEYNKYHPRD